jgi:hypothetical protein
MRQTLRKVCIPQNRYFALIQEKRKNALAAQVFFPIFRAYSLMLARAHQD